MSTVEVDHGAMRRAQLAAAIGVRPTVPGTTSAKSWHQFGRSARQVRQHLTPVQGQAEVAWCKPAVWFSLVNALTEAPVPELGGVRLTYGLSKVLAKMYEYAGSGGDQAFVSTRRLAEDVERSTHYVFKLRSTARDAGLLLRMDHGARRGARDVLACPGGTEGALALIRVLRERKRAKIRTQRPCAGARSGEVLHAHLPLARRILREDYTLAGQIATWFGQVMHVQRGAELVVAHVLARSSPDRKIQNFSAYVMAAVRRDKGTLAALWPRGQHTPGDQGSTIVRPTTAVERSRVEQLLDDHPQLAEAIASTLGLRGDQQQGARACVGEVLDHVPAGTSVSNWSAYVLAAIRRNPTKHTRLWLGAQGEGAQLVDDVVAKLAGGWRGG